MPGAVETVRRLALDGFTLGIVSSAVYPPFLDWTLDAFGIRDAFSSVVTSAGAGYYKSRPEIYRVALDALGATPAETVHVGDSFRFDHLAARSAGLRTVWVAAGGVEAPEDGPPPHLRLESLVDAADPIAHLAARPL
jgi:HAD superfamily hydrolase (TIGR01509 family)